MLCRDDNYMRDLEIENKRLRREVESLTSLFTEQLVDVGSLLKKAQIELIDKAIGICEAPHDFIARIEELKRRAG